MSTSDMDMEVDEAPTEPLRLFDLPDLVLRQFLEVLDPIDLITMTMCSRNKYERIWRLISRRIRKTSEISFNKSDRYSAITIEVKGKKTFKWRFYHNWHKDVAEIYEFETRKWYKREMRVNVQPKMFNSVSRRCDEEYVYSANCLVNLFRCEVTSVIFIFNFDDNFLLYLKTPAFQKSKSLHMGGTVLRNEEAAVFFDNYKTEELSFEARIQRDFRHSGPMNFTNMHSFNAQWVQLENVFQIMSDCKEATLLDSHLTNEDLNAIIKNWLTGNNKTFHRLSICRDEKSLGERLEEINYAKVLRDIRLWRPQLQRPYATEKFYPRAMNMAQVDIIRHDGIPATVLLKASAASSDFFSFFVWNNVRVRFNRA